MISRFNVYLLAHASGRAVLLWLVIAIVSFLIMAAVITPTFQEVTNGLRPLDLNAGLTAEKIYADLPSYTDRSRTLYLWFAIVDYIYPFAAATFFALLWAWIFGARHNRFFAMLMASGVFMLPVVYGLIDWLENLGFLMLVFSYPVEYPNIADIASLLKATKPKVAMTILGLTLVFATFATWHWWRQRD